MNVCIACELERFSNPFIRQFAEALAHHPAVDAVEGGLDAFWSRDLTFDVVHIHWPKELFPGTTPSASDLDRLADQLAWWGAQCPIVATVHNRFPHHSNAPAFRRLYDLVYQHATGIVHMGEASRTLFAAEHAIPDGQTHRVIPHGDYACFANTVTRAEARRALGLAPDDYVILNFGFIRHREELDLLLRGFGHCSVSQKRLVIAGRVNRPDKKSWTFVRTWLQPWLRLVLDPRIQLHEQFIANDAVQTYVNAADVLVIPRTETLNSGNVALGFTFGRPVVGPDLGNVGEVLRATGNPVFDPAAPRTLGLALDRIHHRAGKQGRANAEYTQAHMQWPDIAEQHVAFYANLALSPDLRTS